MIILRTTTHRWIPTGEGSLRTYAIEKASLATRVEARRTARPQLGAVIGRVGVTSATSPPTDIVDQWGMQSFPASDPPANW